MVQDVWDPELFVLRDPSGRSALLADDASVATATAAPMPVREALAERVPVYVVAVPGLTGWAGGAFCAGGGGKSGGGAKRARDDDADDMADVNDVVKRPASAAANSAAPVGGVGGAAVEGSGTAGLAAAVGLGLNTPLREGAGVATPAVVAKFYDVDAAARLKVHSVVRMVGVVVDAPVGGSGGGAEDAGEAFFAEEVAAHNPVGVRRLHVVRFEVLDDKGVGLNPLLNGADLAAAKREMLGVAGLREGLVKAVAGGLGGDRVAAEYVLMALLGRPVRLESNSNVMGKLSVNAILPCGGRSAGLVDVLREIAPSVAHINLSIAALNAGEMYPRKDYTANRLRSGPLQLPAGCVMVVDETGMTDGRLMERGVKNIRALTSVAAKATVPVDFQYYETEFPVDASAVFLSAGAKSLIPVDVQVRVVATEGTAAAHSWDAKTISADDMRRLRMAVSLLADDGEFSIPAEVARRVEESFVAARQSGAVPATADGQEVLNRWLAVARASARSFGEAALTLERWDYAMGLEKVREERNEAAGEAAKAAAKAAQGPAVARPPRAPIAAGSQ